MWKLLHDPYFIINIDPSRCWIPIILPRDIVISERVFLNISKSITSQEKTITWKKIVNKSCLDFNLLVDAQVYPSTEVELVGSIDCKVKNVTMYGNGRGKINWF